MKKTRNLLIILIVIIMLFSLCACNGGTQQTTASETESQAVTQGATENTSEPESTEYVYTGSAPLVEEKTTLTIATHTGSLESLAPADNDLPIYQALEELTNVHIEWEVTPSATYQEVTSTRLAAGQDLPDIYNLTGISDYNELGKDGVILELTDLLEEYAPNTNAWLAEEDNRIFSALLRNTDGEIYAIQSWNVPDTLSVGIMYNKTWLDTLGEDVPTTYEELYELLVLFNQNDMNGNGLEDEIPLTNAVPWMTNFMGNLFGLQLAFGNGYQADKDGVVTCDYIDERYKEYLTFMNQLYTEGLFDMEYLTNNWQITYEKIANDQVGAVIAWGTFAQTFNTMHPAGDEDGSIAIFAPTIPLEGPYGDKYILRRIGLGGDPMAITKDCNDPATAMKWLDFVFAGEEAFTLQYWGIEGETYEVKDETKVKIQPESGTWEELMASIGGIQPPWAYRQSRENILALYQSYAAEADEIQQPYYKDPFPQLPLTEEETETYNLYLTDITTYINEWQAKFITGQEPIDMFDEYVKALKNLNIDELIAINQARYDRYLDSIG